MKSSSGFARWGITLAVAGLVWVAVGALNTVQAGYYALCVGIDHYRPGYASSLGSCVNDARGFRTRLLRDRSRWRSSRINNLINSSATEYNIKRRLLGRAGHLRRGDVFVYYHSSHGGQYSGRNTYLCTYASDFTDRELGSYLGRFRSGVKIIVVLDACHSGGMFKSGETPAEWPFGENVMKAFREEKAKQNLSKSADALDKLTSYMGFMSACDYDETCWAGNPYSLYTRYLFQACVNRAADAVPRNGFLSFYEAHRYARPRAYRRNRGQTAQHRNTSLLNRTTMIRLAVALTAPTLIGPTGSTVARPLFTWRGVSGASSYQIEIYNSSGSLYTRRTGITRTTWKPTWNMANGGYSWRARAYRSGSYGPWSGRLYFTVSPGGAYLRRITLTWGANPRDLDSHLKTPTGAHIYYRNKGSQSSAPYAQLDVDDTSSYGPENISVYRYYSGGYYKYYVHLYAGTGSMTGARVQVQNRYQVLRNFTCPSSGSRRYWHVFNMWPNGSITKVNRVQSVSP